MQKRPLILSPAGSMEALTAAINAGADEVYFGLSDHNARQNAKNFTAEETAAALRECKLRGVKSNITLNTLVTDREIPHACRLAYDALCMGADAFIVQDLGLAAALKKSIPGIVLHASTQCACHNKAGAEQLAELGFERIVLARELGINDIKSIVSIGIETEIFVHGALCVCHSGMCLMSSVIGKRSGNRGLCAQPCRLPYNIGSSKASSGNACKYPLSLKDLSLAMHIPEISELGVTSLKIEGRMKTPEYVYGVTGIWKNLVAENRVATAEEYNRLEMLFSRSGFTDGYFTEKYRSDNRKMYGIRTESDKEDSKSLVKDKTASPSKRSITVLCEISEGKTPILTLSSDDGSEYTASADFHAQSATGKPMSEEDIAASLSKFGDTPFECTGTQITLSGNVFIPKSQLNALRRAAADGLEKEILSKIPTPVFNDSVFEMHKNTNTDKSPVIRIFADSVETAQRLIKENSRFPVESICIPLGLFRTDEHKKITDFAAENGLHFGVRLPRVVFTGEETTALDYLIKAKSQGARYALAENIGHLPLIKKSGLTLCTGFAMNVFNSFCVKELEKLGAESVTLSPELNPAQMRDIYKDGNIPAVTAKGHLELMVLESCVLRASDKCKNTLDGQVCGTLCDRTGAIFSVKCEHRLTGNGYPCRNIIVNGIPVHLIDKQEEIIKTGAKIYNILP